jgi:hypothetical protein
MNDIAIGLIVLVLIFGSALFGMLLGRIIPTQHLSAETRDVIRVVMAMLATLSAVVLGLLTGSSISSLAEKDGELRSAGVQFIMLDRTLAAYGPETAPMRIMIKELLTERIDQIWPNDGGDVSLAALGSGPGINKLQQDLFALTPQSEEQRWHRDNALAITYKIAESRWTTIEQLGSRFPWPFFIVVVSWLMVIFASFGLFAPRNASVTAALLVAALGLSGALFMILEMDQPYSGLVRLPDTSLRNALEQLGD